MSQRGRRGGLARPRGSGSLGRFKNRERKQLLKEPEDADSDVIDLVSEEEEDPTLQYSFGHKGN